MAEIIVIETQAFYALLEEVIRFTKSEAQKNQLTQSDSNWISINEAQKILPFKSRVKWLELRKSNKVVWRKVGRKILYSKKSILELIDKTI